jgi:N-acetyl-alpha-D-glucosaminyl L-malate synthase BshA
VSLGIGITCFATFGGSGIIATEIAHSLARRGHRVHLVCAEVPVRMQRFVENLYFHEVEAREYPLFEHGQYPLALASRLVEVATYEKLDILHMHYALPHAVSAYLARQILGAGAPRVVTTLHGTDITVVGNDRSYLPITRFSIMQSDGVTVPSAFLQRATYENFDIPRSMPIEVIPNFVDSELYRPVAQKAWAPLARLFPRRQPESARPRVLVHSSNFRPLKRVDDVVRVFAEVQRHVPCLLVLIGDGPERSRIEALVRELGLCDVVSFLGKQLDFVEVLQHSDVFLLPSVTESFGLAALEALSCGVPVVAFAVGGLPEVVGDDGGILVAPRDLGAMALAVRRLLEDEALHQRMCLAARARVLERFPLEPLVGQYEDYYRRVLAR